MAITDAPPKTAVIIEDDADVRHLLSEVLEAAGFSTVSVGNGIDGVQAVTSYQPLVTTLDVNMPGIDGFEAAKRIREVSSTYIIMLTGLTDEADAVLGLGAGADDYIVKPFRPREFRARIDALMRRPRQAPSIAAATPGPGRQDSVGPSFPGARPTGLPAAVPTPAPIAEAAPAPVAQAPFESVAPPAAPLAPAAPVAPRIVPAEVGPAPVSASTELQPATGGTEVARASGYWVTHRDLQLNPETRIVLLSGAEIELTRTEFELLATLLESKRRVRSKADLTLVLRGESYVTSYFVGEADKRAVEAHMTNLRRKLGDNPQNPRYIETVRGVGYRLTSELLVP